MECKCSKQTQLRVATSELIDTLWNVNTAPPISAVIVHVELIDTLWNVNLIPHSNNIISFKRINRYIMECKSQKAAKRFPCIRELIDTLWNVNNCLFSLYCRKQY